MTRPRAAHRVDAAAAVRESRIIDRPPPCPTGRPMLSSRIVIHSGILFVPSLIANGLV